MQTAPVKGGGITASKGRAEGSSMNIQPKPAGSSKRLTAPKDLDESELEGLDTYHDPLGGCTRLQGRRLAGRASAAADRERRRVATNRWLLTYSWDIFVTLTWRKGYLSRSVALKQVEGLLRDLSVAIDGNQWRKLGLGLYALIAWEKHQSGALHAHLIVGRWCGWKYKGLHDRWNERAGFAWIKPVSGSKAIIAYTVKYASKGGKYDVFGTWPPSLDLDQVDDVYDVDPQTN